ncbi:uncharacterized protein TNCV_3404031 [Trichonephila clavipes]|nr:uncharacterized protein TNCV_3404031 [Trichonephila clavipes]
MYLGSEENQLKTGKDMYSTQVNSRDLFFSNPADRFLGNDAKTSIESGFSSSFGFSQSGNSKELLNSASQELFNHTPKINACEGQVPNVEYHKYISQNLLFGKKGRTVRKFNFGRDKNELNTEEKSPLKSIEVQDQNDMSEIKELFGKLFDGIKKLNTDISEVRESVKSMDTQIARQNERMGSFEEVFYQQEKNKEENEKTWKKLFDQGDINVTKMQKNITEVTQAVNKVKKSIETNQDKIMESIRKNSTSQANKKWNEEIKKQNVQIMKVIDSKLKNIHTTFEIHKNEIKNYYDMKIHQEVEDLKSLITSSDSSLREFISSQKTNSNSLELYNSTIAQRNNQSTFKSSKSDYFSRSQKLNKANLRFHKSPIASEPRHESHAFTSARSEYSTHLLSVKSIPLSPSTRRFNSLNSSHYENRSLNLECRSAHTPLAETIPYNKTLQGNELSSNESPHIVNGVNISANILPKLLKKPSSHILSQQPSRRGTMLNIKRKITTPNVEVNNLMKRNLKSTSKCSSTFFAGVRRNQTEYTNKNDNAFHPQNIRTGKTYANMARVETETNQSSPYLTLYEATSRADEFTFG